MGGGGGRLGQLRCDTRSSSAVELALAMPVLVLSPFRRAS
jgi:hypothetical protein